MKFLDYEYEYVKKLEENILFMRENLYSDPSYAVKIVNWSNKYRLHPEYVKKKILTDDLFALNFIKEPGRQNFHENLASDFIKSFDIVKNYKQLAKGGKNAKVIFSGMILNYKDALQSIQKPKTIDFEWTLSSQSGVEYKCFATHKYTKEAGGSQDNQYADIKNFMENALPNKSHHIIFYAICDGDYYQNLNRNGKNKIEELNDSFSSGNKLKALTINQLLNELNTLSLT